VLCDINQLRNLDNDLKFVKQVYKFKELTAVKAASLNAAEMRQD
jgi:hypothetical protein